MCIGCEKLCCSFILNVFHLQNEKREFNMLLFLHPKTSNFYYVVSWVLYLYTFNWYKTPNISRRRWFHNICIVIETSFKTFKEKNIPKTKVGMDAKLNPNQYDHCPNYRSIQLEQQTAEVFLDEMIREGKCF